MVLADCKIQCSGENVQATEFETRAFVRIVLFQEVDVLFAGCCLQILLSQFRIGNLTQQVGITFVEHGDTSVGMTLENALGIEPNDYKGPDYKGIELKASRKAQKTKKGGKNRVTLFSQVPEWEASHYSERKLLDEWGYYDQAHGLMSEKKAEVHQRLIVDSKGYIMRIEIFFLNKYQKQIRTSLYLNTLFGCFGMISTVTLIN